MVIIVRLAITLMVLCSALPTYAQPKHVDTAEGKDASLKLLEEVVEHHTGRLCSAKLADLKMDLDETGSLEITITNERLVPESRILQVARVLPANQSLWIGYCARNFQRVKVTAVLLSHSAWKEETAWMAKVSSDFPLPAQKLTERLSKAELIDALRVATNKLSPSLPKMMGPAVRWEILSRRRRLLSYTYTLVTIARSKVDTDTFHRTTKMAVGRHLRALFAPAGEDLLEAFDPALMQRKDVLTVATTWSLA